MRWPRNTTLISNGVLPWRSAVRSVAIRVGSFLSATRLTTGAVLILGCVRQPELFNTRADQTAAIGESFRLPRGKTAEIQGRNLRIRFEEVLEDSRCPAGVQCVWAGDARVVLRLTQSGREASVDTLRLTLEPHAVTYGGYVVRLEGLEPSRQRDTLPRPDAYVAALVVSEAPGSR